LSKKNRVFIHCLKRSSQNLFHGIILTNRKEVGILTIAMPKIIKNLEYWFVPFIIFLACFNPHFPHGLIVSMEAGQHLSWVNAILEGKIPYRDMWMHYGPLQEYSIAFLMKLFGTTLLVQRAFFHIGFILALIIGHFLAKAIIKNRFFTYMATWLLITETTWPFWTSRWGGLRVGFGFLGILLLVLYNNRNKSIYLYLAGIISMLAFLNSIDYGMILLAVTSIYLLSSLLIPKEHKFKALPREIGTYLLGIATVLIPFFIYYAQVGALKEYISIISQDTLLTYPRAIMKSIAEATPGKHVPWLDLRMINNGWMFIKSLNFKFYLYSFVLFVTALYLLRKAFTKRFSTPERNILVLGIFSLGLFVFGLRRFPSPQFRYGLSGVVILTAFFLNQGVLYLYGYYKYGNIIEARKKKKPYPRKYDTKFALLSLLFVVLLFWYYALPNNFAYGINFIKDNLNRYGKTPSVELVPLRISRAGGAWVPRQQAKHITDVTNYIMKHTLPDEGIFVFPHEGYYYFFTERTNPTRFGIAIAARFRPTIYEKEIIRDLEKDKTKYIIYTTDSYCTPDTNPIKNENKIPLVVDYIKKNYNIEKEFGGTSILRREG